ncbi:Zn-dependent hydrolase [Oryzibacter oryziterrae]|uniref:Zn-dependent hydrolase n=1 Tax=Oryzibacter oryziterrae TaxID=2766474 RepID=UPI001F1BE9FE|nr:Zn-dependent hydrolase [Oryzibacter oryziterrae]
MVGLRINAERLLSRLDDFARLGATVGGGVNRPALGPEDRQARRLLADLGRARGFAVAQDAIANLFLLRSGGASGAPFLIGSHLDSQPTGGRFDGALGTLTAFEVLEALEDAGVATSMPIELVSWTNEEGSRFAPGAMGSQAFALGAIPEDWQAILARDGAPLTGELEATLAALADVPLRPLGQPIAGYLELHIEQGPSLEAAGIPIGAVTGVQGTRWLEVVMEGAVAHAGTTAATFRRDPVVAAVSAIHALSSVMAEDPEARLTVGRLEVTPGSVNTIAGRVAFSVDLRHRDLDRLVALEQTVRTACEAFASDNRCLCQITRTLDLPPVSFDERLVDLVEQAAGNLGKPVRRLTSGAFHDALFIARLAPAAMIFVPCRNGVSHSEAEYVEPEHVIAGAQTLLEATLLATGTSVIAPSRPSTR